MAILIPAIDLQKGKCVRLQQGDPNLETVYNIDPVDQARTWEDMGAERIHLVDLDAAISGSTENYRVIEAIAAAVGCQLELGGGIREMGRLQEVIELGIDYAVLGTAVITDHHFLREAVDVYPGQIIVAVDVRDNKIAIRGWKESSDYTVQNIVSRLENMNINEMIYTDITRDGMMSGPNLHGLAHLLNLTSMNVIVSGGISRMEDIESIINIKSSKISGVISGRALYNGSLDFSAAHKKLSVAIDPL